MYTPSGSEIIDSSEVVQFYPDSASGNEVMCALATAWRIDEQKVEQQLEGTVQ